MKTIIKNKFIISRYGYHILIWLRNVGRALNLTLTGDGLEFPIIMYNILCIMKLIRRLCKKTCIVWCTYYTLFETSLLMRFADITVCFDFAFDSYLEIFIICLYLLNISFKKSIRLDCLSWDQTSVCVY